MTSFANTGMSSISMKLRVTKPSPLSNSSSRLSATLPG